MPHNYTKSIEELLSSLPKSDISLGKTFLQKRDFCSLKDLVDSALIKVKKGLRKENPKQEYLDVDLDNLNKLKGEVDAYYACLELPEEDEDDFYDEIDEAFNVL